MGGGGQGLSPDGIGLCLGKIDEDCGGDGDGGDGNGKLALR